MSYFSPCLPVIITAPGKYLTRCGEIVEITNTDARGQLGCAGTYPCGLKDRWNKSGRLYYSTLSSNDIISNYF